MLRLHTSNAGGTGLILSQGNKNPTCCEVQPNKEEPETPGRHDNEKRTCKDTARDSHLQAKEKSLRRNKPANALTLDFQPPDL